ncbi:AAA family ATPase [Synechococcus sp. MIT S9451]|uniref:AAA family ATPase n=1 Tax=Synechococcus sp. MIT S9451 TaxID=3082543 RepID=UPI0039B6A671
MSDGGCQGDVQKVPIQSAKEVLETREATDWIVDEFIPRGRLSVLAGASGSGKSSLLYGLAEAVSNGSEFMGQLKTTKGKVCFIQSDESPENAADKLKVMGALGGFHLITDWTVFNEKKLAALQRQQRYDLIILDSITSLLGAGRPDGPKMNEAEFGFDLYSLNKWASENGVAVVMSAHLRKQSKDSTTNAITIDSIFGAGSQVWASSDVWGIWRLDKQQPGQGIQMQLKCLKGRTCTDGTAWNLEGSDEDYSFLLKGVANEAGMTPTQRSQFADQALKLMEGSDRLWKVEDIRRELGCAERHAYRVLKGLYVEDKISRQTLPSTGGRPRYAYAEKTFCTSPLHPQAA